MKFALAEGNRLEAKPGLAGKCLGCDSPMVAKCGEKRVWHWAHRGVLQCDHWWEPETPWHRNWKNKFPAEWQEISHKAENGEKHIADVKTANGRIIEFQHSHLEPGERRSREAFYRSIVWIVDGLRRKRDRASFHEILQIGKIIQPKSLGYLVPTNQCALLEDWAESHVGVYFDFGMEETLFGLPVLWRLRPDSPNGFAQLNPIPVTNFIEAFLRGEAVKRYPHPIVESAIKQIRKTLTSQFSPPLRNPNPWLHRRRSLRRV